ncbi:hypothetical protein LshimejAT787_0306670 [Lyophyllum shimeji]|uniref:Uncharacterized protein n=1 Tax=Lyophyllum shimeji TaxID=47721 RepID=A0A9P3PJ39_LYOSH|nr:hypothetical protein LshimejAT787_0306670 [Lyophyllum shimeji]
MLKRQRPPSPPPSTPTIPLVVDPPFHTDPARDFKRRRVLPPSLDGRSRGWGAPDAEAGGDEDEEYVSSDDEAAEGSGDNAALAVHTSEYQKANSVLHELHALHQHRLLFSSNSHPSPAQLPPVSAFPGAHHQHQHSKMTVTQPPLMQSKDPAFDASGLEYSGSHSSKDELNRVTERYEDTNRLLGSLFLSRRRQLGAVDDDRSNHSHSS